jgi:hypothetical protein
MKLNILSDLGGRNMERALSRAYRMGYEDAKKLYKRGAKLRALRTGEQIAKEICTQCHKQHVPFLRSAYGAGLAQYNR